MQELTRRYGRLSWLLALAYWLGTPAAAVAECCGPASPTFGPAERGAEAIADTGVLDAHDTYAGHECRMDHVGLRTAQLRDIESATATSPVAAEEVAARPAHSVVANGSTPAPAPPPLLTTVRLLL